MKKILLPVLCLLIMQSKATIWTVNVTNNQFTPASLNVVVGDKIHWVKIAGFHTTTSISVPPGAAPWDSGAPLSVFDYTVTVAGAYSYECTIHAPGMAGTFTASSPAPVVLSSFNVSSQDNKPLIAWTTSTEINSDYFSIQKSTNGTDFREIGRVPAAGNTSLEKRYSFTDNNPGDMKYMYYDLAIVDRDGKKALSPIRLYKNTIANSKIIVSLSPNPIVGHGMLLLQYNADKQGVMQVKVIDMQGREVFSNELSAMQGINNGHLHLGGLAPGNYTILFELAGVKESYKITKE